MKEGEEVVRLKDVTIEKQLELGAVLAGDDVWSDAGVGRAVSDSFSDRDFEYKIERMAFLLTINRLYEPSSDLAARSWINEKAYCHLKPKEQWVCRTVYRLAEVKD